LQIDPATPASSLKGKKIILSVSFTGATIDGLSVAATASDVLPWKDFVNAIIFLRPVTKEASFKAFSLASAPLLHKKS